MKIIGRYENDKETGEWKFYYDNGEELHVEYYKNGNYTNEIEKRPGQLEKIGNYENGNKTGEWKYYDEQGNLIKTENY